MRSKEDLEAHAYGIWRTIRDPNVNPMTILIAQPLLHFLLWILEEHPSCCDGEIEKALASAKQGIRKEGITNPIDIILKDQAAREDGQVKARNAMNN